MLAIRNTDTDAKTLCCDFEIGDKICGLSFEPLNMIAHKLSHKSLANSSGSNFSKLDETCQNLLQCNNCQMKFFKIDDFTYHVKQESCQSEMIPVQNDNTVVKDSN